MLDHKSHRDDVERLAREGVRQEIVDHDPLADIRQGIRLCPGIDVYAVEIRDITARRLRKPGQQPSDAGPDVQNPPLARCELPTLLCDKAKIAAILLVEGLEDA